MTQAILLDQWTPAELLEEFVRVRNVQNSELKDRLWFRQGYAGDVLGWIHSKGFAVKQAWKWNNTTYHWNSELSLIEGKEDQWEPYPDTCSLVPLVDGQVYHK